MTITTDTLAALNAARVELARIVDASTSDLIGAWAGAWEEITAELQAATNDLAAAATTAGQWPTRAQILRSERAVQALRIAAGRLDELTRQAGVTITGSLDAVVASTVHNDQQVVTSQLPPPLAQSQVGVSWSRVDQRTLTGIVARTTGQIEALTRPLPAEQAAVMRRTLIRGVAVGDSPRGVARLMMKRLRGGFDGGLYRALNIARTEMLDASRQAALVSRTENADILTGWRWTATLSARTCPACLAMDGSVHPLDEPGPYGHQSCRCTATPLTRSWRDLGFHFDEPASVPVPSGREWFDTQPAGVQQQIMGGDRLARLQAGDLSWDQIPMVRHTSGWRDSIVVRPLAA